MKVRDMSRKQQKAVFASMGDPSKQYLNRLESAEKFHRRRDFLIKKEVISEDTEDKIWRIMSRNDLTHTQKMHLVEKEKAKAREKLESAKGKELAPTTTGKIISERQERFQQQKKETVEILPVPAGINRRAFDSYAASHKLPKGSLISHKGLLLTQKEYVMGLQSQRKPTSGSRITRQPSGIKREAFNSVVVSRSPFEKKDFVRVDGVLLQGQVYRQGVLRNAKVRYPKQYAKYEKESLSKTWKQLKGKGLKPKGDADGDGVMNKKDCKPLDPKKQGKGHNLFEIKFKNAPDAVIFAENKKEAKQKVGKLKFADKNFKPKIKTIKLVESTQNSKKSWKQLKKTGMNPKGDADGDGVINKKDCKPLDKTKQGRGHKMTKAQKLAKKAGGFLLQAARKKFIPTQKERLKKAKAELREHKEKEQVEQLEAKVRVQRQEEKEKAAVSRAKKIEQIKGIFKPKKKSIYD